MRGTDISTGKAIGGDGHIKQSIRDILTTPLGSRVMRRTYGSRLFDLIDKPLNKSTIVDIYAATISALSQWEPRVSVQQVSIQSVGVGTLTLSLACINNDTGDSLNLSSIDIS